MFTLILDEVQSHQLPEAAKDVAVQIHFWHPFY
jgi:hypothetical protein